MIAVILVVAAMSAWAFAIVLLSRWKYGIALLGGLAAYVAALLMMRAFGFAAVALGWVAMAAIMSLISAVSGTPAAGERRVPLVPGMIASFIVGLIGWPLIFPGIRTPKNAAQPARVSQESNDADTGTIVRRVDDYDDAAENPPAVEHVPSIAAGVGVASTFVDFPTPLVASVGASSLESEHFDRFVIARATGNLPARLSADDGRELATWDERAIASMLFSTTADGDARIELVDLHASRTTLVASAGLIRSRDAWYAIAAAFARVYPRAVLVSDSLEGLDA